MDESEDERGKEADNCLDVEGSCGGPGRNGRGYTNDVDDSHRGSG